MSKNATVPAAEPTMADLMALIQAQAAQIAALQKPVAEVVAHDFSEEKAAAEKAGFKAQVVPSLQKGASPALRVDY
jgi:hypothetical protein